MTTFPDTAEKQTERGGRVRWPPYTQQERSALESKFLGDWENLEFLECFWDPIYDDRDLLEYKRIASAWRMRHSNKTFKEISRELQIDPGKAGALVTGKNLRPHLVQMYLNNQRLSRSKRGWKWINACTPKPTNPYPKSVAVPPEIHSFRDITKFLAQFEPIHDDDPALQSFELSGQWARKHRTDLFGFLLGFLVGDAGKSYPEYEQRSRHYHKMAMTTNMALKESNFRVLRYVQLCLDTIGIPSHQLPSGNGIIRWNSEASDVLTWILRVCLGLKRGQRTSRNPITMTWLMECPKGFVFAFFQGVAESDGSVNKHGYFTEIGSIPNSRFFKHLLDKFAIPSRVHPKVRPTRLRLNLAPALKIPLFHPIIASYRFQEMVTHAKRRKILPPSPLFLERLMS